MPATTNETNPPTRARTTTGPRAGAQAGLDVLLTDAAVGRGTRRFIQPRAVAARRRGRRAPPAQRRAPRVRHSGSSSRASPRAARSRRPPRATAASPTRPGQQNWLLRRVMQGYLAVGETVDGVISDAQLDWQTERQARFAASNVLDALAPTNFPLVEPGGAAGDRRRGRRQPRARRPALRRRRLVAAAAAAERRHGGLRGRRQPRRLPGLGRAAHRGLRAHPVQADHG